MEYLDLDGLHAALFEILTEFDRVCRENGLKYTLAYGTLLGAVRHKGFIPWDDDVDVCMPRPDYERLIELAKQKGVLRDHFLLSKDRGKGAQYPFVKLMDDRYPIRCRTNLEVPYLYVDIFPLDGLPDDEKQIKKLYAKERRNAFVALLCKWYTFNTAWGWLLRVIGFPVYLVGLCIGQNRTIKKLNALASRYPYEESKLVGIHSWGLAKEAMPRETFEEFCELPFGDRNFLAIKNWDGYLTHLYGDYMTPPPENKRISHTIRCHRRENT